MGDFTISDELRNEYTKKKIIPHKLKLVEAEEFHSALESAKKSNPFGTFVTLHEINDYKKMTLLLTEDNKSGIAITNESDIVSFFKADDSIKHVALSLIPAAIEIGGKKLDNYNSSKLSMLYGQYGFIPVSKVKFDRKYAVDDWNYLRDGEPDILFWVHNGNSAAEVVKKFGNTGEIYNLVKEFDTYEQAKNYRNDFIRRMQETNK